MELLIDLDEFIDDQVTRNSRNTTTPLPPELEAGHVTDEDPMALPDHGSCVWDEIQVPGQDRVNTPLHVMESQTDWEVLGVGWGATQEGVNQAFRRLVLQHHPDKNPDPDATAKFRRIQAAREQVLQYVSPSNFKPVPVEESRPFDPYDEKYSDDYWTDLCRGRSRRAEAKAQKVHAEAVMEKVREKYKAKMHANNPAPKTVPIFDGRPDPYAGRSGSVGRGTLHTRKAAQPLKPMPAAHHEGYKAQQTSPKRQHSKGSLNHTVQKGVNSHTEDFEIETRLASAERAEPEHEMMQQTTSKHSPAQSEQGITNEVAEHSRDPFEDLRSVFRGKGSAAITASPSIGKKPTKITKPISQAVPKPTVGDLLSLDDEAKDCGSRDSEPSSTLADILQDLASIEVPTQKAKTVTQLHQDDANPSIDSQSAVSESTPSSGVKTARARLAEKINTNLHMEEAERLERLKYRDPTLYRSIKDKGIYHPVQPMKKVQEPQPKPPTTTAASAELPVLDKPFWCYKDIRVQMAAYIIQQEKEREDMARQRNRTCADITEANRRAAVKLREQAAQELKQQNLKPVKKRVKKKTWTPEGSPVEWRSGVGCPKGKGILNGSSSFDGTEKSGVAVDPSLNSSQAAPIVNERRNRHDWGKLTDGTIDLSVDEKSGEQSTMLKWLR